MRAVTWAQSAVNDLRDIQAYLEAIDPALASAQLERIILSTEFLSDFPGAGVGLGYKRWRCWRARRTPCFLIYEPTRDGPVVARVRHGREDWRNDEP